MVDLNLARESVELQAKAKKKPALNPGKHTVFSLLSR
jgi:hypothetical protein